MEINGEWGNICGDRWTMRNTMVVCKQLGLGYAAGNYSTAHYGTTGKILMSGITCLGREASLDECLRHENVSCSRTKRIAAVMCQTSKYATVHSIYGSTSHCLHIQRDPKYFTISIYTVLQFYHWHCFVRFTP